MSNITENIQNKDKIIQRKLTDKEIKLQEEWLKNNKPKRKDINFDITSLDAISHRYDNM